jgi:hypothetical protein
MPAMETRVPQASISLYAGRTLEFVLADDAWCELRGDGAVVARLQPPLPGVPGRAESVEGQWWIRNPRGAEIDAGREGSDQRIATYRPTMVGGRIHVEGEGRYRLRPRVLRAGTGMTRGLRTVASIDQTRDLTLRDAVPALTLLIALQAVMLEEVIPTVAAGGGGP